MKALLMSKNTPLWQASNLNKLMIKYWKLVKTKQNALSKFLHH